MLSIVVPVFDEEQNLVPLYVRLAKVAKACADTYEIIFVDDGSRDGSRDIIEQLMHRDPRVRMIALSRNFGHEIATTAGLDRADGDAVVIIDADLQDPPEVIGELVERWRAGADVVYAQRRHRPGESLFKRASAHLFYRVIDALSEVRIPHDTGDFRLMDRRVVMAVRRCRENPRFVRGLISWVGFRQEALLYDRAERFSGVTKYNLPKLIKLSWEAICAFSLIPLRFATWLGGLVILFSVMLTAGVAYQRLFANLPIPANALLACGLSFLGGIQLLVLGVMSQYVGHIFRHTQQRPLYLVDRTEGWSHLADTTRRLAETTRRGNIAARSHQGVPEAEPTGVASA